MWVAEKGERQKVEMSNSLDFRDFLLSFPFCSLPESFYFQSLFFKKEQAKRQQLWSSVLCFVFFFFKPNLCEITPSSSKGQQLVFDNDLL